MSAAVIVFAKRPEAGRVKTRLCPPLHPQEAAELYTCMLDDVLEATARTARELGMEAFLAVHPPAACQELGRRAPAPFRAIAQRGDDLAARMEAAAQDVAALGFAPLLLRGSDSPAMDAGLLRQALSLLRSTDLVLSPGPDGGYDLVGLARPAPGLFRHPMSTDTVLADTLRNGRTLGLTCELLPPSFDLDVVEDLERLRMTRETGGAADCPRTLAWLDARAAWPAG